MDIFELALKIFWAKENPLSIFVKYCIFTIKILILFAWLFLITIFTDLYQVLNLVDEMEYDPCSYDIFWLIWKGA